MRSLLLSALAVFAFTAACSSSPADESSENDKAEVAKGGAPQLCVAVRGNGEKIVTHFASLSRIVETYGPVDALAGGSSGSISQFVYESIAKNPEIYRGGKDEKAKRVALALKSVQGYAAAVAGSDEGLAVMQLVQLGAKLKAEAEARNISALATSDVPLAAQKLREVLAIPELKTILNPEILAMLADQEHLAFNVKEIQTAISTFGAFSVDDNRLFFRPGLLSWDSVAKLFGRVGDFYAGYGPSENGALGGWLDACANESVGKSWEEIAPTACGIDFGKIASAYRTRVRSGEAGDGRSRLDDLVGAAGPVRKLVSTSVLQDEAVPAYGAALAAYRSGAHAEGSVPFAINFRDVKFGYWGSQDDLDALARNEKGYRDAKTARMTSLGNKAWREVLTASPAEPGLSRLVELPDGRVSAGGWSDLAPVLVLKNIGCENVVYVQREGDESEFATKVAKNLGMKEAEFAALFDLGNAASGYSRSVAEAEGVWCTTWNAIESSDTASLARDSYSAPFETRSAFAIPPLRGYSNVTERAGKPGCTPGLSGGMTFPR